LYPEYIEYNLLTENLDLETLEYRREKEQIKLLANIFNGKLHCPYILEKLKLKVPNNRLRPSNDMAFHLPNRKKLIFLSHPLYQLCQLLIFWQIN
jgi:hypothetical protein